MQNIFIREYELSQYHAGQIVTPSAWICSDLSGAWHSYVSWYDASDRTTRYEHSTHATKDGADKCIMEQVSVSCDSSRTISMVATVRLASALRKLDISIPEINFDPQTCVLTVGGIVTTEPEREIRQQVKAAGWHWNESEARYPAKARHKNELLASILNR